MDYHGDGGGGGGFQGYGGGGGSSQSPQQQQRTRRQYDEQTLIPVTIRMALAAKPDTSGGEGSLQLEDGRKLASVKIVAAVRSCNDYSTNILLEIEDGTGLLDVKQWFDDSDCSYLQELKTQVLKDNIYVKIVGQLKVYDNKMQLVANSIHPITSGNEITHHMISVVHSAEKFKRGSEIVPSSVASSMMQSPMGGGVGFSMQSRGAAPLMAQSRGGGGLKDVVYDFVRNHQRKWKD
jgi:replication factor A2